MIVSPGKLTFCSFLFSSISFFLLILFIISSKSQRSKYLYKSQILAMPSLRLHGATNTHLCPCRRSGKSLLTDPKASCGGSVQVKLPLCDGSVPPGLWFPLAQATEAALRCCSGALELPGSVLREVLSSCHSSLREQLCHREAWTSFQSKM